MKVIATNRKARVNYEIIDTYEVGVVLNGDEVKSIRTSGCSINESFARIHKEEIILFNMHIPEFTKASSFASDPRRERKLLLHKKQITRLMGLVSRKMYTLIPLKLYFNNRGLVKIELALARGKKIYDKRKQIKEDYTKREISREIKKHQR